MNGFLLDYDFMQFEFVRLLNIKVCRHLPAVPATRELQD